MHAVGRVWVLILALVIPAWSASADPQDLLDAAEELRVEAKANNKKAKAAADYWEKTIAEAKKDKKTKEDKKTEEAKKTEKDKKSEEDKKTKEDKEDVQEAQRTLTEKLQQTTLDSADKWKTEAEAYLQKVDLLITAAKEHAEEKGKDDNAFDRYYGANTRATGSKKTRDAAQAAYQRGDLVKPAFEALKRASAEIKPLEVSRDKAKSADPKLSKLIRANETALKAAKESVKKAKAWTAKPSDTKAKDAAEKARKDLADAKDKLADAVLVAKGQKEPLYPTERFFLHAGIVSLAPFTIKNTRSAFNLDGTPVDTGGVAGKPKVFYLEDSSSVEVRGFLEFRYRERLAWDRVRKNLGEKAYEAGWWFACDDLKRESLPAVIKGLDEWLPDRLNAQCWLPSDVEIRTGFTFGNGGDIDGAAIAGSGDLNVSMLLGWPCSIWTPS